MGCGPDKISFLSASMNVDNVNNLQSWYYRHSDFLGKSIHELTNELIMKARDYEIQETFFQTLKDKESSLTIQDYKDEWSKWKQGKRDDCIGLDVSYDMGWQKKSSGRHYDSLLGHCFLVGLLTNKIIGLKVYSKACSVCESLHEDQNPDHECSKNWHGSSGSMECYGALDLRNEIYGQYNKVFFENFLSNNDSATRATISLKENNPKGQLPDDCTDQPTFWQMSIIALNVW